MQQQNIFVILLRGINVSGKRKIPMAELRSALAHEFSNVQTYIQSGNIIVKSSSSDTTFITGTVKSIIESTFGYSDVPVFGITVNELNSIIDQYPFDSPPEQKYISFLQSSIISQYEEEDPKTGDKCIAIGKVAYITCAKYGQTKFSNQFIEKTFNKEATTRNWKTVLKLASMVND